MNIILFTEGELQIPIPRRDRRAKHILKVLRLSLGDSFHLGLIDGPRGTAQITGITDREILFDFQLDDDIPQLHPVHMIIGLPRPRSARRILKDVTTQGASELHFVATDSGEKSYLHSNLWTDEGYRQHLLEGAEQAFCTRLPKVVIHPSLKACLNQLNTETNRIVLDNYEATQTLQTYPLNSPHCVLAIGSERGWSDDERNHFRAHGFTLASLGDRVLKTETACIAALAITLAKLDG